MTMTADSLGLHDVYTPEQIARLGALQGVATFAKGMFNTVNPSVLIELAEYVIGDDEPFDPVDLAHKARAAIRAEQGYDYNGYDDTDDWGDDEDGPLPDWERELLGLEPELAGPFTVSDLAGFLTLPTTAILEDEDGDTWTYHEDEGWGWSVYDRYTPQELFDDFAPVSGVFHFVVTNPEVLS